MCGPILPLPLIWTWCARGHWVEKGVEESLMNTCIMQDGLPKLNPHPPSQSLSLSLSLSLCLPVTLSLPLFATSLYPCLSLLGWRASSPAWWTCCLASQCWAACGARSSWRYAARSASSSTSPWWRRWGMRGRDRRNRGMKDKKERGMGRRIWIWVRCLDYSWILALGQTKKTSTHYSKLCQQHLHA